MFAPAAEKMNSDAHGSLRAGPCQQRAFPKETRLSPFWLAPGELWMEVSKEDPKQEQQKSSLSIHLNIRGRR